MNHYLLGFIIGAAIGAATVAFTSSRSGPALRGAVSDTLQEALDAGRTAQAAKEQQLWADFRAANAPKPALNFAPLDDVGSSVY